MYLKMAEKHQWPNGNWLQSSSFPFSLIGISREIKARLGSETESRSEAKRKLKRKN